MIRTLIIGLGNIGFKFDRKNTKEKITHSSSIFHHKKFQLIGGVDKNLSNVNQFKKIYRVPGFKSLKKSLENIKPDLIIFTTQPKINDISHLSKYNNIKFILFEKPFIKSKTEIEKILKTIKHKKIFFTLNFQRNFSKKYNKLMNSIKNGIIGNKFKTFCFYNKSFESNGTHFLNLINIYYNNVKKIHKIGKSKDDIYLKYKNGEAYFFKIAKNNYNNNCIVIYGDKGKIEITSRPENCIIYKKVKDKIYKKYFILQKTQTINLTSEHLQNNVLKNIYNVLKKNGKLLLKEKSLIEYLSIINKIKSL